MNLDAAKSLLAAHGQEHLLGFYDMLDDSARQALLDQLAEIDFDHVDALKAMLPAGDRVAAAVQDVSATALEPVAVTTLDAAGRAAAVRRGEEALRVGAVGALLVAGGQGTRLGFDGPKGCCPIGPVSDFSLFYFHARKLLARKRKYGRPVPLYVMTSAGNDAETRRFFKRECYFGLAPEDVFFFMQGSSPALDPQGRMILEAPGRVFLSPDGHGGVLSALEKSGAFADMRRRGVEMLYYFQVDNPMLDVADPAFVGHHLETGADWTMKVCERAGAEEKIGMPAMRDGRVEFFEYTEQPVQMRTGLAPDGTLRFRWGAPAIHMLSVAFLERAAGAGLPFHLAHKKVPFAGPDGATVKPDSPNAYKFEKFVFDALPLVKRVRCLEFDRKQEFSPVKNAKGDKSPDSARRDLSFKWERWLRDDPWWSDWLAHAPFGGACLGPVEIDPVFADSPEALAEAHSRLSGGAGFALREWEGGPLRLGGGLLRD